MKREGNNFSLGSLPHACAAQMALYIGDSDFRPPATDSTGTLYAVRFPFTPAPMMATMAQATVATMAFKFAMDHDGSKPSSTN